MPLESGHYCDGAACAPWRSSASRTYFSGQTLKKRIPLPDNQTTSQTTGAVGRGEVIGQLFREHNRALVRFLMNRLRSSEEAADVAQEAYARMLQLDAPGTISYLRAFLFKTAANIAIDRLRLRKVDEKRAQGQLLASFGAAPPTEQHAADAEELRLIITYIDQLPPQQREVLLLSRFEPLSTAEIAARVGISERTVQHYIVESLVYIRARLERATQSKPLRVDESRR